MAVLHLLGSVVGWGQILLRALAAIVVVRLVGLLMELGRTNCVVEIALVIRCLLLVGHLMCIAVVMLLHPRVRVLLTSIVVSIFGHVAVLTVRRNLSIVRVAIEVVVNHFITGVVVSERALLAVIIFAIVVFNGRRFRLLFLVVFTIAVIAACFMVLVDRPKGSCRGCILGLPVERLLQSVRVARVLPLLARGLILNHVILVLLRVLVM